MPKLSKVEECLLCEAIPCECSGVKKTKARPKKSSGADRATGDVGSVQPEVAPVRRASMRDAMKAAAASAPPQAPVSVFDRSRMTEVGQSEGARLSNGSVSVTPPQPPSDPSPDAVLAMAIRNLAPLLHEDELKKYEVIVGSQATSADRAAFWRAAQQEWRQ